MLLKEIQKRRCKEEEDEEEDVNCYWLILREKKKLGYERESATSQTLEK